MKIRYLNGAKVCAVEDNFNGYTNIYRYKDIAHAINRIFKEAEISESKIQESGDYMNVVLTMIAGIYNLPSRRISTKGSKVTFDDEKNIKTIKEPKLKLPKYNNKSLEKRGLRIIAGGKFIAEQNVR